jgi:hypothetical protein
MHASLGRLSWRSVIGDPAGAGAGAQAEAFRNPSPLCRSQLRFLYVVTQVAHPHTLPHISEEMTESSKSGPSYFVVPDEKINYDEFVQLGNVLYSVKKPDKVVSKPRLTEGPHPLGSQLPPPKVLKDYTIKPAVENESKIGFFAKILELLGFGINASRTKSTATSKSYTITSMAISTFNPSDDFLTAVKADARVNDVLQNSQDQCAFLITGIVVATGVKFTSLNTIGNEKEGSLGISSHGFSFGPSGSKRRKKVLELGYTDEGPVTLAFKVQKLQLREDGTLSAEDHVEGSYFEDDEKEYIVDEDAPLVESDVEEFQSTVVVDEISNEEYVLYA